MISILLFEDNKSLRGSLVRYFDSSEEVSIVGAYENANEAVANVRKHKPDVVLMDIQMPVMTGLQATKEIRRLERVNGIGVFSSASPDEAEAPNGEVGGENSPSKNKADDKLSVNISEGFKSPVIIVALTASSLQSDRHEALAAGCNDFLTKPVNFVWLERKVKEWGCMQALIDFDGWRKWKDYAALQEAGKTEEERQKEREKEQKDKVKMEKMAKLQEKQAKMKEEKEREKKKRMSLGTVSENGGTSPSAGVVGGGSAVSPAGSTKEKDGGGEAVNGEKVLSPGSLKSGKEVLGEANFGFG